MLLNQFKDTNPFTIVVVSLQTRQRRALMVPGDNLGERVKDPLKGITIE
jgi:hypothetical protein